MKPAIVLLYVLVFWSAVIDIGQSSRLDDLQEVGTHTH